jgi:hypothetical protein
MALNNVAVMNNAIRNVLFICCPFGSLQVYGNHINGSRRRNESHPGALAYAALMQAVFDFEQSALSRTY